MNQKKIKKKITIPAQLFKNLVSEDTLRLIQILDKHSFSLEELKERTSIPIDQLKIELAKLGQGNIVKEKQYQSKSSQYSLTFKGSSLLHPENSRIMILFCTSIFAIAVTIGSVLHRFIHSLQNQQDHILMLEDTRTIANDRIGILATETSVPSTEPFFSSLVILGLILCIVLTSITIWRYKKNKAQAL